MSDFNRGYTRTIPADRADMSVDAGLRSFMLGVYNKVALGLVVSAAMAFLTSSVQPVRDLLFRVTVDGRLVGMAPLGWAVAFGPILVILFSGFGVRNQTPRTSGITYWTVVTLMGASLGVLALVYTGSSIATTFLITASAFGVLSLVGYTTKRDMTAFNSFLIMGVWGLLAAMVANMFLHLQGLDFVVNILGVFIFGGLIATGTQELKMNYYQMAGDQQGLGVMTNFGALTLYIRFINLFQFLLRLTGGRR
ncbi:Bax inhibitor-1/YccA family protein [Phenylobacterium aquaticum]|uniref:Bax inhibitor-1/YccA family protein n=1 Tax=Phenylobacterium aquaticum TaxID=1763816 RepID=UPI001F5E2593|nr:Bax inhibitor-1/YccA family protein [Phenylobacterium aquaticum]MCI3132562.1 Bax inhibitor-1/YccA family protein [Phenylobacterium aquaticum]